MIADFAIEDMPRVTCTRGFLFNILNLTMMRELMETRFFALLAGESFEGITREELKEETREFAGEVARLCDSGEEYLSTCRTLSYTKTWLLALQEIWQSRNGEGKKGMAPVESCRGGIKSG